MCPPIAGTKYDWFLDNPRDVVAPHAYRDVGATAFVRVLLEEGSPMAQFESLSLDTLRPRILAAKLLSNEALDDAEPLLADHFWDLGAGFSAAGDADRVESERRKVTSSADSASNLCEPGRDTPRIEPTLQRASARTSIDSKPSSPALDGTSDAGCGCNLMDSRPRQRGKRPF
jgi:hypothetical protein